MIISGRYGAKQHNINEIRDNNFNKKVFVLSEFNASTDTANQGASERFSCFRLALLNELFALRELDLISWISSIYQKAQACLVLIQNPNIEDNERVDFSISTFNLLALSARLTDKKLIHQRIAFLIDGASNVQREEIISKLIDLRPMMWYNVISACFLLSDAIPEQSLGSVAEWCVKYNEHPTDFQSGWRLDWLTFWGEIFGYYSWIDNIYDILHPVMLKAAGNPHIWHSDKKGALEQYLINAPMHKSFEVADKMFEVNVTKDRNFNDIRWSAVYNAAHKRKEIADKYKKQLIETATTPVLQLYSNFIYTERDFEPLNDAKKREWIRKDIFNQIKNVLGRDGSSFAALVGVNPEVLSLITWPDVEKILIQELIKALNSQYISKDEIGKYFKFLIKLISIGHKNNIRLTRKYFKDWLLELPKGYDPLQDFGIGPFSGFQVTAPDEGYVLSAFSYLALEMVKHDTKYSAPLVSQWLKDKYSDLPRDSRGLLFCLIVSLSVNSDFLTEVDMAIIAQELIHKSLWESVQEYQDRPSAAKLIDQIAYLMDLNNEGLTSLSNPFNKKRRDILLSIIEKSIGEFTHHVNPNVRAGTAKLLSNWKIVAKDIFSKKCQTNFDILKHDVRARVRYSASV